MWLQRCPMTAEFYLKTKQNMYSWCYRNQLPNFKRSFILLLALMYFNLFGCKCWVCCNGAPRPASKCLLAILRIKQKPNPRVWFSSLTNVHVTDLQMKKHVLKKIISGFTHFPPHNAHAPLMLLLIKLDRLVLVEQNILLLRCIDLPCY